MIGLIVFQAVRHLHSLYILERGAINSPILLSCWSDVSYVSVAHCKMQEISWASKNGKDWQVVLNPLLFRPREFLMSWHLGHLEFTGNNSIHTFLRDSAPWDSVPLCYLSICQDHVMGLVSGLLCADSDLPLRMGVIFLVDLLGW